MIIRKFEVQVKRFPDKIAVKDGERAITYAELNRSANRLANEIMVMDKTLGNPRSANVSLLFEHGPDAIIGIIGVLKAAKTYIPLDVGYPDKRLSYMLEHSESYMVLTNTGNYSLAESLAAQLEKEITILNIDTIGGGFGIKTWKEKPGGKGRLISFIHQVLQGTPKVSYKAMKIYCFLSNIGVRVFPSVNPNVSPYCHH